jgi:hypothetical protein
MENQKPKPVQKNTKYMSETIRKRCKIFEPPQVDENGENQSSKSLPKEFRPGTKVKEKHFYLFFLTEFIEQRDYVFIQNTILNQ